jgi:hypothetical protein
LPRKFCSSLKIKTMATIAGLLQKIRDIKQTIADNRAADALRISADLTALVKLRIQREGKNSENAVCAPYVPAYKKERAKAGFQTEIVDFTRSGRMFAAVRPVLRESGVFSATVAIEGTDDRSRTIIAGAERKRGNILEPTPEEVNLAREANKDRIKTYLDLLKD